MPSSEMVQSLKRGMDIISIISDSEEGLGLTDLSAKIKLKKTTVHNLARTLCSCGYLEKDPLNRYQIGPAIEEIYRRQLSKGIFIRAENTMKELYETLNGKYTITFSELTSNEIICRIRISYDSYGRTIRPQMYIFSVFGSATGICFLSFNLSFQERILASELFEESPKQFCKNRRELHCLIDKSVKQGAVVISNNGFYRIAVPVTETFALGLSFYSKEISHLKNILTRLKDSANKIKSAK